jgi:hypothetical protein
VQHRRDDVGHPRRNLSDPDFSADDPTCRGVRRTGWTRSRPTRRTTCANDQGARAHVSTDGGSELERGEDPVRRRRERWTSRRSRFRPTAGAGWPSRGCAFRRQLNSARRRWPSLTTPERHLVIPRIAVVRGRLRRRTNAAIDGSCGRAEAQPSRGRFQPRHRTPSASSRGRARTQGRLLVGPRDALRRFTRRADDPDVVGLRGRSEPPRSRGTGSSLSTRPALRVVTSADQRRHVGQPGHAVGHGPRRIGRPLTTVVSADGRQDHLDVGVAATGPTRSSAASSGIVRTVPGCSGRPGSRHGGDAQVTASWTPPADDGGSPVTGYTAVASPRAGRPAPQLWRPRARSAGWSTARRTTVTVTATRTRIGTGPGSAASNVGDA